MDIVRYVGFSVTGLLAGAAVGCIGGLSLGWLLALGYHRHGHLTLLMLPRTWPMLTGAFLGAIIGVVIGAILARRKALTKSLPE
jgi:hypothetical protein